MSPKPPADPSAYAVLRGKDLHVQILADRAGVPSGQNPLDKTYGGHFTPVDRPTSREEKWLVIYDDVIAVLLRNGELWDVKPHGQQLENIASMATGGLFSETRQEIVEGGSPALDDGAL